MSTVVMIKKLPSSLPLLPIYCIFISLHFTFLFENKLVVRLPLNYRKKLLGRYAYGKGWEPKDFLKLNGVLLYREVQLRRSLREGSS